MIELGMLVMLACMGAADVLGELRGLKTEERRLLREQRAAARDEDERKRAGKVKAPIGYRA